MKSVATMTLTGSSRIIMMKRSKDMEQKKKMAITEAQKRATAKYLKESMVQVAIRVNKNTDMDVLEYLQTIDNKRAYFLSMIRADISRHSKRRWYLLIDPVKEELFRVMKLNATSKAEAIAEAEQIKSVFDKFVGSKTTWSICSAIEDEGSLTGDGLSEHEDITEIK